MSGAPPPYIRLEEDINVVPANEQASLPASAAAYYPAVVPVQPASQQLIITQGPPVVVQPVQRIQSFAGHIVLSCFVFWCCGFLFGLIAFILAGKKRHSRPYTCCSRSVIN